MARPRLIPKHPVLYNQLLEDMAFGLPQVQIAKALQVPENTLCNWKKRKDFGRDLALKKLEVLRSPIKSMAERFPKDFIERHPETRETFAPPTQKQELSGALDMLGDLGFDRLLIIAQRGNQKKLTDEPQDID